MIDKNLTIGVIGGYGYLGSEIVRQLVLCPRVTRIDVVDSGITGNRQSRERVVEVASQAGRDNLIVEYYDYNIGRDTSMGPIEHPDNVYDAIIVTAALTNVVDSMKHPQMYWDTNVDMVRAIVERGRTDNFILTSSAAAKGIPTSVYGQTKMAMEVFAMSARAAMKKNIVCLRPFNIVGVDPRMNVGHALAYPTLLLPKLAKMIVQGGRQEFKFRVDKNGNYPSREFIHVEDVARAHVFAALQMIDGKKLRPVYDVSTGRETSLKDIKILLESVVTSRPDLDFVITNELLEEGEMIRSQSSNAEHVREDICQISRASGTHVCARAIREHIEWYERWGESYENSNDKTAHVV